MPEKPKHPVNLSQVDGLNESLYEVVYFPDFTGQNSIWDLVCDPNEGKIYVGLCSECADKPGVSGVCAVYDPKTGKVGEAFTNEKVISDYEAKNGRLPHGKVHSALDWLADGRLISCTHVTSPGVGRPFWDLQHSYDDYRTGWEGSHIIVYDPKTGKAKDWGIPVPRADFNGGGLDPQKENYYLVDFLRGNMVRFDLKTREVKDYGNIRYRTSDRFQWDRIGRMFFFASNGRVWRFTPDTEKLKALNVYLPRPKEAVEAGRNTTIYYPTYDSEGVLYGDVAYHGRLCRYDSMDGPEGRMDDLGMPLGEWDLSPDFVPFGVGGVCFGPDGYLYFAVSKGSASGVDRKSFVDVKLMRYNPRTEKFQNLGTIYRDGWGCVCVSESCAGLDGKVYLADCGYTDHPPRLIVLDVKKITDSTRPVKNGAYAYSLDPGDPRNEEGWEACRRNVYYINRERLTRYEFDYDKIPFGSMAVSNLFFDPKGHLRGSVGGEEARIFQMDDNYQLKQVVRLPEAKTVMPGMSVFNQQTIYGIACKGNGNYLFSYPVAGDMKDVQTVNLDFQDKLSASLILPEVGAAYLLGEKGTLWKCALADGKTQELAHLRPRLSRVLVKAADGCIYGQAYEGTLFRIHLKDEQVEKLDLKLPGQKGRDYMSIWTAAVTQDGKLIYGGNQDGYLFSFEPLKDKLKSLGKPCMNVGISILTLGPDGWVYGVSGDEKNIGHLFRYHPQDGFQDEGWINQAPFWQFSVIGAMAFGPDGRLFLGQAETISHIVAYRP